MSFMYQIDLGPADPIWLVHTVQGPNCNEIIIFHRDALVCGKEGTLNLGIYASPVCYYWGIGATCTKYPGTHNWGYRQHRFLDRMKLPLSLTMRQLVRIGFPKLGDIFVFASFGKYEEYVPNSSRIYGAIGGCTWSIPFRVPQNDPCTKTIYQQNMHTHVSFTVVIDTHVDFFYLLNTTSMLGNFCLKSSSLTSWWGWCW